MTVLDSWLQDFPQQFLGQPRIEALVSAFARQLQELERVFSDVNEKTDLETATGQNLDYVGTVIPLTRKEAAILAGAVRQNPSAVMRDDEAYRKLLKYQRLVNTNECTYYDLMEGASFLLDTETTPIHYSENPDKPATIILSSPSVTFEDGFDDLLRVAFIRPAGVGVEWHIDLSRDCLRAPLRIAPVTGDVYFRITVPAPSMENTYDHMLFVTDDGNVYEFSEEGDLSYETDNDGNLYYLRDESETPPTFVIEDSLLYREEEP